jgi:hypothetical protein
MRIPECRDTVILQRHLTELWESCPAQEPLTARNYLKGRKGDPDYRGWNACVRVRAEQTSR